MPASTSMRSMAGFRLVGPMVQMMRVRLILFSSRNQLSPNQLSSRLRASLFSSNSHAADLLGPRLRASPFSSKCHACGINPALASRRPWAAALLELRAASRLEEHLSTSQLSPRLRTSLFSSKGHASGAPGGLAIDHDAIEGLGERIALALAELGIALADALLHARHVLDLADMAQEGLDLEVDGLRDVDHDLGIVPPHHVHFLDPVRLQALGQELGKGHVVTCERIDAVQENVRGHPVITVRRAEILRTVRVLADDQVRPMTPDGARYRHARLPGVLEFTVGEAEEVDRLHAQHPGGVPLLLLADLDQALRRHGAVARALVAVGENAVGDGLAFARECGHGAARPELGVVGVRRNNQDILNTLGHVLSWIGF